MAFTPLLCVSSSQCSVCPKHTCDNENLYLESGLKMKRVT